MKLGEIIKNNNWLSVEMVLLKLYPDEKKNISGYEEVFNKQTLMNSPIPLLLNLHLGVNGLGWILTQIRLKHSANSKLFHIAFMKWLS